MTRVERVQRVIDAVVARAREAAGSEIRLGSACKTDLLLGADVQADVFPYGDLYYSQVKEIAGNAKVSDSVAAVAEACGGLDALEQALILYYDRRMDWATAVAHLPAEARELLWQKLEQARFRRKSYGIVPKLGPRTIGIDLY